MGKTIAVAIIVASVLLLGTGCTRNVDWTKQRAPQAAEQAGFEIIGYEGYQWSVFFGGDVWYTLRRTEDNGIIYHACFVRRPWTDEIHIYELKAIDALKP